MSAIMLEGVYGPREIAPESVWSAHARPGILAPSWQSHNSRFTDSPLHSSSGVWLPGLTTSLHDLRQLHDYSGSSRAQKNSEPENLKYAQAVLAGATVNETGCWQSNSATPEETIGVLTDLDSSRQMLEPVDVLSELRQCNTSDCLQPRHYDITLSVPSNRRALLYPNLAHFAVSANIITTAWGDVLQSVQTSRERLTSFRKRCPPYAIEGTGILSFTNTAQLALLPTTGCWLVRSYYMTPLNVSGFENWQYDGYGRLRIPARLKSEQPYKRFASMHLAHRIVWLMSGKPLSANPAMILNHKCGFRPCANPNHLEQISHTENIRHGLRMKQSDVSELIQ
jgi:hypothetical protein